MNYATLGGQMLSFNYKSIYMDESDRLEIHKTFVVNHYLKQFNEETIKTKQFRNCGEPCAAVRKKMHGQYKNDYEPYQAMGPLAGIFDQRAAEKLNHHANTYGFDAISVASVIPWLMECLSEDLLNQKELGVKNRPVFSAKGFDVISDSMHNAQIGVDLLDSIIEKRGIISLDYSAEVNSPTPAEVNSPTCVE